MSEENVQNLTPSAGDAEQATTNEFVEKEKYLKLLKWFRLFYKFFQEDIKGKPSACASALAEDSELQDFVNESKQVK